MGQRFERHVGRFPRQLCYLFEFRRDGRGARRPRHLSLQQFRVPVPPFAPRGPSGRFPHFLAPTAALRLPSAPALPRSRSARRFHLPVAASGPPRFLGNPPMHALLSDPGGTAATGQSGIALLVASVLPSAGSMASAPTRSSLSGLNPTAYMLAVYASPPGLPLFDARLASGWWPTLAGRDSNPLGPFARFQLVLHGILLAQASPGAPKLEVRSHPRSWSKPQISS